MKKNNCELHVPCLDCEYRTRKSYKDRILVELLKLKFDTRPEILEVKIGDTVYTSDDKGRNEIFLAFRNSTIDDAIDLISKMQPLTSISVTK